MYIESNDIEILEKELKRLTLIDADLSELLEETLTQALDNLEDVDSNKKLETLASLEIKDFIAQKKSKFLINKNYDDVGAVNAKQDDNLAEIKKVSKHIALMKLNKRLKLLNISFSYAQLEFEDSITDIRTQVNIEDTKALLLAKDFFKMPLVDNPTLNYGNFATSPEVPQSIYDKYSSFGYTEHMNLKRSIIKFRRDFDFGLFGYVDDFEKDSAERLRKIEELKPTLNLEAELLDSITKEDYKTLFTQLFMDFNVIRLSLVEL